MGPFTRSAMASADDAFPTLDPDDISTLDQIGRRQPTTAGEYLYRSGDQTYDFYVIVAGAIDIVLEDDGTGNQQVITRHGTAKFLGELNMLTGQRLFLSARVAEPGEVIRIPAATARQLIATHPRLGDTILTAFMARRAGLLSGASTAVRLVGSPFTPATRQLREFLSRSCIPHEWSTPNGMAPLRTSSMSSPSPPGTCPRSSPVARCCAGRPPVCSPTTSVSRSAGCLIAASTS